MLYKNTSIWTDCACKFVLLNKANKTYKYLKLDTFLFNTYDRHMWILTKPYPNYHNNNWYQNRTRWYNLQKFSTTYQCLTKNAECNSIIQVTIHTITSYNTDGKIDKLGHLY